MIRVRYLDLSEALINQSDLQVFMKNKFNLTDQVYDRIVKSKIERFIQTHNSKYMKECHCNKKVFLSKNKLWLDRELICCEEIDSSCDEGVEDIGESRSAANGIKGRKLKPYEQCSQRTKRRRCQELQENASDQQIKQSFFNNLRQNNQSLDVKIIKQLSELTTESKQKLLDVMQKGIEPVKYSSGEALALYVDAKMTKYQYELMAHGAATHNSQIYPSYHHILDAKKQCYPDEKFIKITDVRVSIELQALLDLTCAR